MRNLLTPPTRTSLKEVRTRCETSPGLARKFLVDDSGQDLVEYGLLSALIGVASVLIWQQLVVIVGDTYSAADGNVQTLSACTPNPDGSGCP